MVLNQPLCLARLLLSLRLALLLLSYRHLPLLMFCLLCLAVCLLCCAVNRFWTWT